MVLLLLVVLQSRFIMRTSRWRRNVGWSARARRPAIGDGGQTTAEYALVLIGAAALALLLIAWATRTDRIGKLFDFVMDHITGRVQ